eukprot:scaffold118030_cov28-Prasinocladus_malaysianus.AAC.2
MSRILWAFAKAKQADCKVWEELLPAALEDVRMGRCSSMDMSLLLWAYANVGYPAPNLFKAAETQLVERTESGLLKVTHHRQSVSQSPTHHTVKSQGMIQGLAHLSV